MTTRPRILSIHQHPARPIGWVLSLIAVAAIALAFATRLAAAPVAAPVPASRSASVAAVATLSSAGSGCWVTGDLVGDANPLQVYAAACGAAGSPRQDQARP